MKHSQSGTAGQAGLIAICVLCALYYGAFEIRTTPIFDDTRYYLYFSARVAQGEVPYRDFFEVKTPLSFLVGGWLYRSAEAVGVEPLLVLRSAFLGIGALSAVAMFAVQRRLGEGRFMSGFLGASILAAMPVLGLLPSVGVLPKSLVALFSLLAALAVDRGRWVAAGACGALAFLDWQVGGLVILAGAIAGLAGATNRALALVRVLAGAGAVLGLVATYFAVHGALTQFLGQTLGVLFDRSVRATGRAWESRTNRIVEVFHSGVPDGAWLPPLVAAGVFLFVVKVWRERRERPGFLAALGTYHFGLVAFSLLDFQYYDDLFILLYSLAFFAGIAAGDICRFVLRPLPATIQTGASAAICVLVLLGAWWNAPSRNPRLRQPTVTQETRLSDQIQVAQRVLSLTEGRRVAFLGAAEIPFLANVGSVAPIVYWNTVAYSYYGREDEPYLEARHRIMRASGAELLVGDRTLPPEPGDQIVKSDNGAYWVVVRRPY